MTSFRLLLERLSKARGNTLPRSTPVKHLELRLRATVFVLPSFRFLGAVVFRTRGQDTVTVAPVEFIRRFLDHRSPKGFVRIRYGGLLSPINVNGRLAIAKTLLPK